MNRVSPKYLLHKYCEGDPDCERFVRDHAGSFMALPGHDPLTDELFVLQSVRLYNKNNTKNKDKE
jgi:hypothetical protein